MARCGPVPAAILADECTGATIMRAVLALDAGPMDRVRLIQPDDTAGTLLSVAEAGADLLMRVLPAWEAGAITHRIRTRLATYAPQIRSPTR
jgi:methionyl-tRNA formyltransferase